MAKVEAVSMNIKDDNELKSYIVLNKAADENSDSIFTFNGKNYVKVKLSDGTYKYMLPIEGEDADIETKPEKEEEPTSTFFSFNNSKYDRAVDNYFDIAEKLMGIDNTELTSDEENDGNISWWEKTKRFAKGAILNPLKSIVRHPLISLGAAAGICLAAAAAPVIGTIALVAGVVIGAGTTIYGAYKASNAKTDSEARNAWENIGTGVMTAATCGLGFFKLVPKDTTVTRTWLSDKFSVVGRLRPKKITPSNDGMIRKVFYRPTQVKRAFFNTVGKKEDILAAANSFKNQGKWESLGLEIQKLKLLAKHASDDKSLIRNIEELTAAYKTGMAATYPVKSVVYAGNGLAANMTDNSALAVQTIYDTAPAFAN